ncbi:TetR/AcrR family transcriptional regulator [Sphingomonas agri]|uniref:TetR/AcrR family transcriptional regulator n=1 Tax=Sphingomonas agri TaxID=1813878 RepID=UPI00311E52B7
MKNKIREPAAARRRRNDPAGLRRRILDAAFELFQARGYNATSVHEIAASAGVTGGALHHHFATKKSLGLAVIEERVSPALDTTWLRPVREAEDAARAILDVFGTLADELDGQGSVRGCPVNNLTLELAFADADYRDALRRLFDSWRETIAARIGGPDGEARAATVISAYSGAMAIAKVEQRGEPLRVCAREISRLL